MNDDRITEVYEGIEGSAHMQRVARRRIHWMCERASGRVLDVGCSQGIASILLAREGMEVVGLDREEGAVEFARSRLSAEEPPVRSRLEFIVGEAAALPFADRSFGTVLLGEVIEHLLDPRPIVAEAARVLEPGGQVVITTPYGEFASSDHKEPIYLAALLELLAPMFAVRKVELLDRYLAIVAEPGPLQPDERLEVFDRALSVSEARIRGLERPVKSIESIDELNALRAERDALAVLVEHQSAVLAAPNSHMAWLRFARAHRTARNFEQSLACAERALELKPGWTGAILHIAGLHGQRGDLTRFRETLRRLGPGLDLGTADLGRAATLAGRAEDWEMTAELSEELCGRELDEPMLDALLELGARMLDAGLAEGAHLVFSRALELAPGHQSAERSRARAAAEMKSENRS